MLTRVDLGAQTYTTFSELISTEIRCTPHVRRLLVIYSATKDSGTNPTIQAAIISNGGAGGAPALASNPVANNSETSFLIVDYPPASVFFTLTPAGILPVYHANYEVYQWIET